MSRFNLRQFTTRTIRFLNQDFCPSVDQYVNWLKQPIGWIATGIFFSVLVGIFLGSKGFVLACAFLMILLIGLAWPWLSMKGVHCELILPENQIWEGEEATISFRVRNFWPLPVFGMMIQGDFLQDLQEGEEPIAFSLKCVPAWSETQFRIPTTPQRRGMLPCGEVTISNGFPFGLIDISRPVPVPAPAMVWPACQSLQGHPQASEHQFNVLGSLCDRSGNDGETIGVRVYRNGDQLRNIHWAQTVRSHRLMVRERQTVSSTMATVVMDLSPNHHAGLGVYNSFEWAIRISASVCFQLHQSRSPVRVICDGLPWIPQTMADNGRGIRSVMDFLAGLPTLGQSLEAAETESGSSHNLSRIPGGRVFYVGTCRSPRIESGSKGVNPIVIDLTRFLSEAERSPEHPVAPTQPAASTVPSAIHITTPEAAAIQLGVGWKRSFNDVSC